MMSSSKVIRSCPHLPVFTGHLAQMERLDVAASQQVKTEAEVQVIREAAYSEGHALGYRDGFVQAEGNGLSAGRERGYDEGKARFEEEHADVLSNFRTSLLSLLTDFQCASEAWFEDAEHRYADIAIEVAKRAVATELKTNREVVLSIAKEALQEVRSGQQVIVRVNTSDVSILEAHRLDLINSLAGIGGIEVVADRTIAAGVVIETSEGIVDARVETFMLRIEAQETQEAA